MSSVIKRDLAILDKFQHLLKLENNFTEIWEELDKLVPESYRGSLILVADESKYTPGNLFTWLVMNGIVMDPKEVLSQLKCSITTVDGELGLAGPGPIPFFQPFLI